MTIDGHKDILTIIIPQHSENEGTIQRLLFSINNQVGIDYSKVTIIIVGDGGYKLNKIFLSSFNNLKIKYIYYFDSKGPGHARQIGLENADSDYIAYLDADDMLSTINSLWQFINVIQKTGNHQVIFSRYTEQHASKNGMPSTFTVREYNPSAVYGKWLSLDFIRQHKFSWHPMLPYAYEDTFFMDLVLSFANDIYYLDVVTYTWLYNKKSIVRKEVDYQKAHFNEYVRENRLWIDEIRRRAPQRLYFDINNGLVNIYQLFLLHEPIKNIIHKVNNELMAYILENKKDINLNYSIKLLKNSYPKLDNKKYLSFWSNLIKKALAINEVNNFQYFPKKMKIFLSIIIPIKNKNIINMFPLLFSIANQKAIDFKKLEIIIVNDGGINIENNFSSIFPSFNIICINLNNSIGPGPARSVGLHKASGEYVMFCDSDDQLHKLDSLFIMKHQALKNKNAEIIFPKYLNEQVDSKNKKVNCLAIWNYNHGALYPKWFKMQFLKEYEIDFHPDIHTYYEDTYFCGIAQRIATKIVYLNECIYTKKANKDSLIHSDTLEKRQEKYLLSYCYENYYWFEECKKRFPQKIQVDLNNFVISLYYMHSKYNLNNRELNNKLKEITKKIAWTNKNNWLGWTVDLQRMAEKVKTNDSFGISSESFEQFINQYF